MASRKTYARSGSRVNRTPAAFAIDRSPRLDGERGELLYPLLELKRGDERRQPTLSVARDPTQGLLAVAGDAFIRSGLRGGGFALVALGFVVLGSCGVVLNQLNLDSSRLPGTYIEIFALVSILVGRFHFKEEVPLATSIGLGFALMLVGILSTLWAQLAMGDSWRSGVDVGERTRLVTSGPFAWVRNPIFTSMLAATSPDGAWRPPATPLTLVGRTRKAAPMPDPFGNGAGGHRPQNDPFPEIREFVDAIRARLGRSGGGGGGGRRINPWLVVAVLLVVWFGSGIFIVGPDERGLVLRFGKLTREVGPGPGYHLPWPFEEVIKPSITQIRKDEFGFRTLDPGPPATYSEVDPEALMLTGDGNIIKLQFIVQYRIRPDASGDFVFNARDARETLRVASEAAMRQVVGNTDIDDALTEGRAQVEQNAQRGIQEILDSYQLGIDIVTVKLQDVAPPDEVSDAFKDVISAEQDKERLINEAKGYANDIVPRARGRAAQILNEADAYRLAKIEKARGDADRFTAMLTEYEKARDVTRMRLYLETMQEVLPRMNKILIDDVAGQRTIPYLPLDSFIRREPPAPPAEPARR